MTYECSYLGAGEGNHIYTNMGLGCVSCSVLYTWGPAEDCFVLVFRGVLTPISLFSITPVWRHAQGHWQHNETGPWSLYTVHTQVCNHPPKPRG